MHLVIDRFEEQYAVCEYEAGKTLDIPRKLLPQDAKAGDVLCISIDHSRTEDRKKYADELRAKLFRK